MPCSTDQHDEQEPRPEAQDEARAGSGRRTSFKTSSVRSHSADRVLPFKTTGRPRSLKRGSRVASRTLGYAGLTPHSCPLLFKPPGSPHFAEHVRCQPVDPATSALGRSTPEKPKRGAFYATQLHSSPSGPPASGPQESVFETVSRLVFDCCMTLLVLVGWSRPMLPLLSFSPCLAHKSSQLDFSIAPAWPATVAPHDDLGGLLRVLVPRLEGDMRPLVQLFPRLAHTTAHWSSVLRLFFPLL